ncbi:hypothetical protein NPJ88_000180 [Halomonas elongata]|uniref:hypothetical protein n=1 Tax=Halomonas elongata TaxID=2746 RepID=UPI00255A7218|nr:hypothetical protein [Halomonas elongata]MDL4860739.1 hypothetical protein [Halomonas elongata]
MPPITGEDLERWRLAHTLSKHGAAKAFGVQIIRWQNLTEDPTAVVDDKTLQRLYRLYEQHPETIPVEPATDFVGFYESLGFDRASTKDMDIFGDLIGRSANNVYRIIHYEGNPSQVITKYINGVMRLPKNKRLSVMKEISKSIVKDDPKG